MISMVKQWKALRCSEYTTLQPSGSRDIIEEVCASRKVNFANIPKHPNMLSETLVMLTKAMGSRAAYRYRLHMPCHPCLIDQIHG